MFFVFLSMIFYDKRAKGLMYWGKLQGVQEPDRSKPQSLKSLKKAPVLPIREECDRKFASPQRHTPEPHINNDILI